MDARDLLRLIALLVLAGLVRCQSNVDMVMSANNSSETDFINILLKTRKTISKLRQKVEKVEIVLTGVTQLLQQLVLQCSISNTSVLETRLGTVEMRLETLGTKVEPSLQQLMQSLSQSASGVETHLGTVDLRLQNLVAGVLTVTATNSPIRCKYDICC